MEDTALWTDINKTTQSQLSKDELRRLRHACRIARLSFVAMACQPRVARELIARVEGKP